MESHEVSSVDLVSGEVITSSIKENKSDCVPKEPVDIQYDNKESYDTSKHGEPNDKVRKILIWIGPWHIKFMNGEVIYYMISS